MSEPLLQVEHLKKYYPISGGMFGKSKQQFVKAVDDISFTVQKARRLGLSAKAAAANRPPAARCCG
ncbi:hypothetical protein HMSSN036_70420 [Paenibacillus macerans]|nr:hypothetical protein HMSSN036_70420 [Paenibacillus macerans]